MAFSREIFGLLSIFLNSQIINIKMQLAWNITNRIQQPKMFKSGETIKSSSYSFGFQQDSYFTDQLAWTTELKPEEVILMTPNMHFQMKLRYSIKYAAVAAVFPMNIFCPWKLRLLWWGGEI